MGNDISNESPRHSDHSHDPTSPPSTIDRAKELGAQLHSNIMNQTNSTFKNRSGRRRGGDDGAMAIFDNMCGDIRETLFDSNSKKGQRRSGNYSDHSDDYSDDDATYDSYHDRKTRRSSRNKKKLEESDSQSLVSEAFTEGTDYTEEEFIRNRNKRRAEARKYKNYDDSSTVSNDDTDDNTLEDRYKKSNSSKGLVDNDGSVASSGVVSNMEGMLKSPLASSFAKRCYFTKAGIGKITQHYEGLTLNGNTVLMLSAAMKLKGCPTICDEDLRRVEQTYPNQFSRLPDELLLSSGWRRISKYCHFSMKPIQDGVSFFHSRNRIHPQTGGYYFLLAAAVGMVSPMYVEPLSLDNLIVLQTDYPSQCDAVPHELINDPNAWILVDKFCFFSGGPINTEEDVYYKADFDGNPIYMLAFLSPSLTPEELYRLGPDNSNSSGGENNDQSNNNALKTVAEVQAVESVYELTGRDFDDLKLYHLGPCRALPPYLLQPASWSKVLPPRFIAARQKAMQQAQDYEALNPPPQTSSTNSENDNTNNTGYVDFSKTATATNNVGNGVGQQPPMNQQEDLSYKYPAQNDSNNNSQMASPPPNWQTQQQHTHNSNMTNYINPNNNIGQGIHQDPQIGNMNNFNNIAAIQSSGAGAMINTGSNITQQSPQMMDINTSQMSNYNSVIQGQMMNKNFVSNQMQNPSAHQFQQQNMHPESFGQQYQQQHIYPPNNLQQRNQMNPQSIQNQIQTQNHMNVSSASLNTVSVNINSNSSNTNPISPTSVPHVATSGSGSKNVFSFYEPSTQNITDEKSVNELRRGMLEGSIILNVDDSDKPIDEAMSDHLSEMGVSVTSMNLLRPDPSNTPIMEKKKNRPDPTQEGVHPFSSQQNLGMDPPEDDDPPRLSTASKDELDKKNHSQLSNEYPKLDTNEIYVTTSNDENMNNVLSPLSQASPQDYYSKRLNHFNPPVKQNKVSSPKKFNATSPSSKSKDSSYTPTKTVGKDSNTFSGKVVTSASSTESESATVSQGLGSPIANFSPRRALPVPDSPRIKSSPTKSRKFSGQAPDNVKSSSVESSKGNSRQKSSFSTSSKKLSSPAAKGSSNTFSNRRTSPSSSKASSSAFSKSSALSGKKLSYNDSVSEAMSTNRSLEKKFQSSSSVHDQDEQNSYEEFNEHSLHGRSEDTEGDERFKKKTFPFSPESESSDDYGSFSRKSNQFDDDESATSNQLSKHYDSGRSSNADLHYRKELGRNQYHVSTASATSYEFDSFPSQSSHYEDEQVGDKNQIYPKPYDSYDDQSTKYSQENDFNAENNARSPISIQESFKSSQSNSTSSTPVGKYSSKKSVNSSQRSVVSEFSQSSAMRGAQELLRLNRQKRLALANSRRNDAMSQDSRRTEKTSKPLSPVGHSDEESSLVSGSSAWTDNSSSDRGSRRALILQMAKARMEKGKKASPAKSIGGNSSTDLTSRRYQKRSTVKNGSPGFVAEDLD